MTACPSARSVAEQRKKRMPWINKQNLGLAEVGSTVLVRCAGVLLGILVDKTEELGRRLCHLTL